MTPQILPLFFQGEWDHPLPRGKGFQKIPKAPPEEGVTALGGKVQEGNQDEAPMMQLWMGESEDFGLEDDVTVEEEVQVNDAGTPARPPAPSHPVLDRAKEPEGLERVKGCLHLDHTIDVIGLIRGAHGVCPVPRGVSVHRHPLSPGEPPHGLLALLQGTLQIRPHPNKNFNLLRRFQTFRTPIGRLEASRPSGARACVPQKPAFRIRSMAS
jgi:hypothetical protein